MTKPEDDAVDLREPRRGALIILLLMALPAVLIGLNQLRIGGRERVEVVGAGRLHLLRAEDAPTGARYALDVVAREAPEVTVKRLHTALGQRPGVIVLGLDAAALADDEASIRAASKRLTDLMAVAREAAMASVVVGYALDADAAPTARRAMDAVRPSWRAACRAGVRQVCVDLAPYGDDADAARQAIAHAVLDALTMLRDLRATTQGR